MITPFSIKEQDISTNWLLDIPVYTPFWFLDRVISFELLSKFVNNVNVFCNIKERNDVEYDMDWLTELSRTLPPEDRTVTWAKHLTSAKQLHKETLSTLEENLFSMELPDTHVLSKIDKLVPGSKEEAIHNALNFNMADAVVDIKDGTFCLTVAFPWDDSPEKYDYWEAINEAAQ